MRAILFLLTWMVITSIPQLNAQNSASDSAIPYELTSSQWKHVQKKWARKNVDATLYLSDSTTRKGQLVAVNDSVVLLWKGEGMYYPGAADSMITEFPLEEVDSVHVASRFIDPRGGRKGMLIGGGVGLVTGVGLIFAGQGYLHPLIAAPALPLGMLIGYAVGKTNKHKYYEKKIANTAMRTYALFPSGMPSQNNSDSVAKKSPLINHIFPAKLISLSVYTGLPRAAFQFGNPNELSMNRAIAIGVNITPNWSAEVQGNIIKLDGYLPANGHLLLRKERWRNLHATANFSVFKTGRFHDRWYQLLVGGGYTFAAVDNLGFAYMGAHLTSYSNRYEFKKNVHGAHLQVKAQLFAGPRLAFFCMANTVFLPSVTLPECRVTDPTSGESIALEEVNANLSWSSVNFGLQFYFRRN